MKFLYGKGYDTIKDCFCCDKDSSVFGITPRAVLFDSHVSKQTLLWCLERDMVHLCNH